MRLAARPSRRSATRRPLRAPLLLAAAIAAITGCGGSGEQTSTAPLAAAAPLSKAEFIRQADSICVNSESRIEAAADRFATAKQRPSRKQVAAVARGAVVPALEAEVQAIEALGEPAQGAAQIDRILSLTKQGIAEIKSDPGGLLDGPPQALRQANKLSKEFGSRECGIEGP